MLFWLLLLIGLPYLGYKLFTGVFDALTGYKKNENDWSNYKPDNITHIHHHTHNNLNVHSKEFENYLKEKGIE